MSFGKSFCLGGFLLLALLILIAELFGPPLVERAGQVDQYFEQGAGRSIVSIGWEMGTGWFQSQRMAYPQHRWLLLGTDEVVGSHRTNVLTDTIMLATYQPDDNSLNMVSFPRDIYLPEYGTKINQLYQLGLQQDPAHPQQVVKTALEDMIGQPLDGVIVLSLADVSDLIDRLGGIAINVPNDFTDEQFPRPGVDVTVEKDPAVLYETVQFTAGWQTMDGDTALTYMRSRHANELIEQGDQARMRRQKEVIAAVELRLQSLDVIGSPYRLGLLYDWYAQHVMAQVSLFEVGWLGGSVLNTSMPVFHTATLPLTEYPYATDEATLFVHPPDEKYQQWAYESVDPSWEKLQFWLQANHF